MALAAIIFNKIPNLVYTFIAFRARTVGTRNESPANHRHERVGEEIAHEINAMLAGELKDPRLEVSVVASEVARSSPT